MADNWLVESFSCSRACSSRRCCWTQYGRAAAAPAQPLPALARRRPRPARRASLAQPAAAATLAQRAPPRPRPRPARPHLIHHYARPTKSSSGCSGWWERTSASLSHSTRCHRIASSPCKAISTSSTLCRSSTRASGSKSCFCRTASKNSAQRGDPRTLPTRYGSHR